MLLQFELKIGYSRYELRVLDNQLYSPEALGIFWAKTNF